MKVLIIGSGFMGTSLALKLKQKNSEASVSCIEQNPVAKAEVDLSDIYDETYHELNEVSDSYDAVIVCTNIAEVKNNVEKCQEKFSSSTLITDISSTKKHISTLINQGYVSSHPICGSEQSGPTTANADVFDSARVVVVGHDVERVKNFWQSLGCSIFEMDARTHDKFFGYLSHLPHLMAFAFDKLTESIPHRDDLMPESSRELLRLGKANEDLWNEIFKDNKEILDESVIEFVKHLTNTKN
ncbi:MAG: prephenate dehydrogenase [Pseudomonadota bacterium]|nr:prephenate dehydrogenase [Pseudomonadota bacterium]